MEEPSDRSGPSLIEYVLVAAIMLVVVIGILILLRAQPTGSIFTNINNGL